MDSIEKVLLVGSSVDGKITVKQGSSSKEFGTMLTPAMSIPIKSYRKWADAVLVGSNTVNIDNSSLKSEENKQLKRLVIDRTLSINPEGKNIFFNDGNSFVITLSKNEEKIKILKEREINVIQLREDTFFQDLDKNLNSLGIKKLLIEGGGSILDVLLKNRFVDKICIAYFPFLIGGSSTPSILDACGISSISEAVKLQLTKFDVIDKQMVYVEYKVLYD